MIFLINLLRHPVTLNMERTISFYFWTLIWEGAWSRQWLLSTSLRSVHMLNLQHDLKSTIIRLTRRLGVTERLTCFPECGRQRCLSDWKGPRPNFLCTGIPSNILPPSSSGTVKSSFFGGKTTSERRASQWQATCYFQRSKPEFSLVSRSHINLFSAELSTWVIYCV